ncbi:hypothetical protein CR539_24865 (plasmid) [Escherichia coli]|uniref:hypothetical protein n=1 Tax=Escherichia coli TaxID=562 RepID=UPI00098BB631|nr:hypothetical protein CR539_24865 [Escherichia coli]MDZ8748370.1 hypothetical protein [Escherichia coli]MDZ8829091.1 hypothetical protein [Escherichia coli]
MTHFIIVEKPTSIALAASETVLTLRQPGMETRCPEGAGQRQRSWPGAKHDSPGSRQGSRP